MASALMAFVQGLAVETQEGQQTTAVKGTDAPEADEAEEDLFGDSGDEKQQDGKQLTQKPPTLLEVAQRDSKSVAPSLAQVARGLREEQQQQDGPVKPTLAALAAEMNQEERVVSKVQSDKIQRALDSASAEVKAERIVQRNDHVAAGLQAAVVEQQLYEDDAFEEDAASVLAAAEALATDITKSKNKPIDRRALSQRRLKQSTKGKGASQSQSMSKLELQRAMQDKLSAFQFQQLSVTQRRLFLATLAHTDNSDKAKQRKKVANREALNELAKDKATLARQKQKQQGQEFARLEDNRHCRFTPRLHNSSSKKKLASNDSDDEEGPGGARGAAMRRNEDFVRRMEAAERARREQLRRTREETEYLARVDKKECPSCGNPQSYSELTQKRKKCPNCGVTYKSRIAWSDVADEFLTRMEEFQRDCEGRKREQQEEKEHREVLACGPEVNEDGESTKKTWEEVRDEFLGRVELDLQHREMSRAAIWDKIQRECSFSPSITPRAHDCSLIFGIRKRNEEKMAAGRSGGRQSSSSRHAPPPPPLPFESSQNEPVRVYPPESARGGSSSPLQAVQAVRKNVVVVGILSASHASPSSAYAFANRLIGRCVFHDDEMQVATAVKETPLSASIHLYYDDFGKCLYLLGVARPETACFSQAPATGRALSNSGKGRPSSRRQAAAVGELDDQTPVQLPPTAAERMRAEIAAFEHEKLKMEVLLYSSCNVLFVLQEHARITTTVLKDVRALAAEKSQLLSFGATAPSSSGKHSKREGGHSKGSSSSSSGNAFTPGHCVPLALYVVPAPDEIAHAAIRPQRASSSAAGATSSTSKASSRSATVAYCKALEARLTTLFRSLRGSTVGSVRMRDVLSTANLGKERRVFNMDPAHSVVVVSRRTATADGRLEARLEELLDALDSDLPGDDLLEDETLLRPLEDDDMGFQRMHQYLHKFLDLLFSSASGSGGSSKDVGGRTELLTPPQWLKAFHALVKSYHRMEIKRKQEAAAFLAASASGGASEHIAHAYQFDPMELSR
ncbi:hypothetical protein BBJ28_00013245 [Nothophytophthora sp. Chile5]|nr:hypothetical protein BBJ28_00013245 [Nothophytophthora sp. Chile5]